MNKIVINEHLDVRIVRRKVHVFVDDVEFKQCMFLLFNPSAATEEVDSIDKAAMLPGAKRGEGRDVEESFGIPLEEQLFAHASNLIAWVEHGYDTRILHSNMAFPLLKELARVGDAKARRVLDAEVEERIREGFAGSILTILEFSADIVSKELVLAIARGQLDGRIYPPSMLCGVKTMVLEMIFRGNRQTDSLPWDEVPPDIIGIAAGCLNQHIRIAVARRTDTPPHVLSKLLDDDGVNGMDVIAAALGNPNISLETLHVECAKLLQDINSIKADDSHGKRVKMNVSELIQNWRNVRVSQREEIERFLFKSAMYLEGIVKNPACPGKTLAMLFEPRFHVDDLADSRNITSSLTKMMFMGVIREAVKHPNLPADIMKNLVKINNEVDLGNHYLYFLENPSLPVNIMRSIAGHFKDWDFHLARNNNLPEDLAVSIALKDLNVVEYVCSNKNITGWGLERLYEHYKQRWLQVIQSGEMIADRTSTIYEFKKVIESIAKTPKTPDRVLLDIERTFESHFHFMFDEATALNPSAPTTLLERILGRSDPHSLAFAYAQKALAKRRVAEKRKARMEASR